MVDYDYDDKLIYTDHQISKYHIWRAYEGFKDFYMDWSMSQMNNRKKKYLELAVRKYAEEFLLQIMPHLNKNVVKKNIKEDNLLKVKELVKTILIGKFNPSDRDINFIRIFAELILEAIGLKDVFREPKPPDNRFPGKALEG